jgi:predicted transcriptional regulator of viral defense system
VTPRQQYFLIVTPDQLNFGAPPAEWWLGDYFKWLGHPYYLALQSAAAVYGSSQQAIQETQVITDMPRRDISLGRIRIRFFMKSGIGKTITRQLPNARAPLLVSTPESTVFDLVRYAHNIGGMERVAETIRPIVAQMKTNNLLKMLHSEGEIATAQRLGFILETIGADKFAKTVLQWLPRYIQNVPLSTYQAIEKSAPVNQTWSIFNNVGAFHD